MRPANRVHHGADPKPKIDCGSQRNRNRNEGKDDGDDDHRRPAFGDIMTHEKGDGKPSSGAAVEAVKIVGQGAAMLALKGPGEAVAYLALDEEVVDRLAYILGFAGS